MKVVIVSGNFLPFSPSGPAYIAGAARDAGHTVKIFDCFVARDLDLEFKEILAAFNPDVVAVSITVVTNDILDPGSEFGTKYVDMRPRIKRVVEVVKENSNSPIILGGPGFNYYAAEWLRYLNLDYGIRGEGECAFPVFLERLERNEDLEGVPGIVIRKADGFHMAPRERIRDLNGTAMPAYDLFDMDHYQRLKLPFALYTKRGCAFGCTYCPYRALEGSRYRLKSPQRVADEMAAVSEATHSDAISFCDNSFNCPKPHAEAVCEEVIARGLKIRWSSGAVKPLGISKEFCRLMKASGCEYVGLSIETGSEKMLTHMNRGYGVDDIRLALDNLSDSDIPFGVSILIGAPGETPDTIAETFRLVDGYPKIKKTWASIGLYLWTNHQKIAATAREEGQLKDDRELFDGAYYISPQLPKEFMLSFINSMNSRKNFSVQVNKPYAAYPKQVHSV